MKDEPIRTSDSIERYIHAACRTLPVRQRADVEAKLRTDIQEMVSQKIAERRAALSKPVEPIEPGEQEIREVLETFEHPSLMAEKYGGSPRCLIGPPLIDPYLLVVRIVLLAVGIGLAIAMGIQWVMDPPATIWSGVSTWISNLIQSLISAFGMVTIIFALIYHVSPDVVPSKGRHSDKHWQIQSLPPLPTDTLRIKPGDPIAAIIVSLAFLIIILIVPDLFGYYQQTAGGVEIIPLFGAGFRSHLLWISLVIGLGIVLAIIKLAHGRWSLFLVVTCLVQNILSLIVTLRVLRDPTLVNDDFSEAIERLFATDSFQLPLRWLEYVLVGIAILAILGFVADSVSVLAKGRRLISQK